MIIQIGHPAYSGDNKWCQVNSKAHAVRELRNRGFNRDQARSYVKEATTDVGEYGKYLTRMNTRHFVVEISVYN